ncbi:Crp/Fnr family transcriptional regulator [Mediterraneibacter agrestimuris]|uniref:Crp/Fnr family transcriptional regulator n=1 Tax=Mediterraneibacter agrestimuris TaxID=2941333 RepID=UPI0020410120|nr:Crp/Fnr family transcriptional regulator [Mediterraneibacter agrestimuris]
MDDKLELERVFPFWKELTKKEQDELQQSVVENVCPKGTLLHYGGQECAGVQIIYSGQARVFITSPNGGEITLFRLVEGDVSILSAACMMKGMDIELDMELETDSVVCTIPKFVYKKVHDENTAVKDYTLEMISEKFSDIMWLFNQYVFSNVASRLAGAILEHRALGGEDVLTITHDVLARDLGTAREVVSRLLKQFQMDGLVKLARGKIEVLDAGKLAKI